MTAKEQQKTLERAIETAIKNGWIRSYGAFNQRIYIKENEGGKLQVWDEDDIGTIVTEVETLIFNRNFAKALWGEGPRPACLCDYENWSCDEVQHNTNAWQYHLQQMVIAEDPIAYLAENLPK